MSILEYNGGAVCAMVGKNCVAVATDLRYGIRNTTVGTNQKKAWPIHSKLILGMSGLATDVQTFLEKMKFRTNMYKLREDRDIKPSSFANMVSSALYENRYEISLLLFNLFFFLKFWSNVCRANYCRSRRR